jgi:hypothetical protein
MSTPITPETIQASQQALEVLQRVQAKVLLEMWTTIMLVAGMVCVLLHQILDLCHLRRCATILIAVYGYAMTWVPSGYAPLIGYATIVFCAASIIRDSMSDDTPKGRVNPDSN